MKEIMFYEKQQNISPVYWMHSILLDRRDELINFLEKKLIETRPFFFPLQTMPPYRTDEEFANSARFSQKGINLPSSINLTEEDIFRICEEIKNFLKK